ncbi:MAG: nikA [Chloroflexi bacterium]|nr:nikA [Chloroflexota bacterium]
MVISPVRWRYTQIQLDPARTQQPALADLRVRRALVLGLDRATMAGIVTEGTSSVAEVPVSPIDPVFQRVQQAITSHPYDTSRAAALLQEAGWSRSAAGSVINSAGQPFALDIRTTAGTDNETEMSIMAADVAGLGIQVTQTVVPQSRIRDNEYRVTFPGLNTTAQSINIPGTLAVAEGDQCATAERRFAGSNRGCWINAEYDRLFVTASSSLDPNERANAVVGALKILTEDTGVFGLAYNSENVAVRKGLVGPGARWPAQIGNTWNIQDWHWE